MHLKINLKLAFTVFFAISLCWKGIAQITATDGDWSKYHVNLEHTPQADQMIRFGDIDNLGFGFGNLDPFKGDITPKHVFPWQRDINDSMGMDMVMVISSNYLLKEGSFPKSNGYSTERKHLMENYGKTNFAINFPLKLDREIKIKKIMMQIFLVDVQSRKSPASGDLAIHYRPYINNRRAEFMEETINDLDQSGELGRLITFYVPETFFNEFSKSEFKFEMDDSITPRAEGFAIDFIKILINPVVPASGDIRLIIKDYSTKNPIPGANIGIDGSGRNYRTNSYGERTLSMLPLGMLTINADADNYSAVDFIINVDSLNHEKIIYLTKKEPSQIYAPNNQTPTVQKENSYGLFWRILGSLINGSSNGSSTSSSSGNSGQTTTAGGDHSKTESTSGSQTTKPNSTSSTRRR